MSRHKHKCRNCGEYSMQFKEGRNKVCPKCESKELERVKPNVKPRETNMPATTQKPPETVTGTGGKPAISEELQSSSSILAFDSMPETAPNLLPQPQPKAAEPPATAAPTQPRVIQINISEKVTANVAKSIFHVGVVVSGCPVWDLDDTEAEGWGVALKDVIEQEAPAWLRAHPALFALGVLTVTTVASKAAMASEWHKAHPKADQPSSGDTKPPSQPPNPPTPPAASAPKPAMSSHPQNGEVELSAEEKAMIESARKAQGGA